jgi:carbonic anhydrase
MKIQYIKFFVLLTAACCLPITSGCSVEPVAVGQAPKVKPDGKPAAAKPTSEHNTARIATMALERDLQKLIDGNRRFVEGRSTSPNRDIKRIRETAPKQKPFATIVSCSDSRVPNEIVFDQGIGDLFVVRTAGQVSTSASYGSIEFAAEVLGSKLIVVLGHTHCGAVQAAVDVPEVPGHIVTLINAIKPAAAAARKLPGDVVNNAIRENVKLEVAQLRGLEPVLAKRVREGTVRVVGALYDIDSGKVTVIDP